MSRKKSRNSGTNAGKATMTGPADEKRKGGCIKGRDALKTKLGQAGTGLTQSLSKQLLYEILFTTSGL